MIKFKYELPPKPLFVKPRSFNALLNAAKTRSKKRGLEFDLTYEWMEQNYTGYCALTGLPFRSRDDRKAGVYSPSLDRIDNDKGYIQTNCRFILHALNMFKGVGTDEDIIYIAKSLLYKNSFLDAPQPIKPTISERHAKLLADSKKRLAEFKRPR
jgi:hypothetical protein